MLQFHPGCRATRFPLNRTDIMLWGALAYDSRSTLIVIQRNVNDILRPHVGFSNRILQGNFSVNNACLHTARVAQDFQRYVQTLP
ncbi:hypothetical protein TNCT_396051 [Trichonephila clavata]|uniref:Uncharacterized protein n=1 Tax=Trichonephila clavata TaxID=2740835 RepID=A0A8X6L2I9_TRICU|nr:hypothetical protein TNCT_396051 [Trichonephila clavata]